MTGGTLEKPVIGINLAIAIGPKGTSREDFEIYHREVIRPREDAAPAGCPGNRSGVGRNRLLEVMD